MRVGPHHHIRAAFHGGMGQRRLPLGGDVGFLGPGVHEGHNDIRPLVLEPLTAILHLLGGAVEGVDVGPQPQGVPIAVTQLEALPLIAGDPGNAIFRQRGLSVPEAGVTEIAGVVIGQGDSLHTAQHQSLHIVGIAAEGVFRVGLQTAGRKGTFQIGQRQIVSQQKLHYVGKGISVVVPHQLFKVVGVVTGGQGAVPQKGDDEGRRFGRRFFILRRGRGNFRLRGDVRFRRVLRQSDRSP